MTLLKIEPDAVFASGAVLEGGAPDCSVCSVALAGYVIRHLSSARTALPEEYHGLVGSLARSAFEVALTLRRARFLTPQPHVRVDQFIDRLALLGHCVSVAVQALNGDSQI